MLIPKKTIDRLNTTHFRSYWIPLPAFDLDTHWHREGLDQRVCTRKCHVHPSLSCNYSLVSGPRVTLNGVLVDDVSPVAL